MSAKDGDTSAQEKGSSQTAPETASAAAQTGPSEDMKAKFRAALDQEARPRRRGRLRRPRALQGRTTPTGPPSAQQMFRRKSGG